MVLAPGASGQQGGTQDADAIRRGVALFDAGDLAGARAAFEAVLAVYPKSAWARYELAYTHSAAGENDRCIAEATIVANGRSPYRPQAMALVGNCLAAAGREKEALKQYRKGLKEYPADVGLNFNAAVSVARLDKTDEARKLLKRALATDPRHASSLYVWAALLNDESNRAPALLVCLRFLMVERRGARAEAATRTVLALAGAGVEQKGNDISLTIPAGAPTTEGDFAGLEFGISMAGAGMTLEAEQAKPVAQRTVDALETVIKLTDEMVEGKLRKSDVWRLAAAPLIELHGRGLWQPFGYTVAALAGVEGAAD